MLVRMPCRNPTILPPIQPANPPMMTVPAFPEGMCTRTLLGKAEVVLWRHRPQSFRVEVRRSFAAHAWDFLQEAAREHAVP